MTMRSKISGLFCSSFLATALSLQAVTLERIVSREDPKSNCAAAAMTVGRDGNGGIRDIPDFARGQGNLGKASN